MRSRLGLALLLVVGLLGVSTSVQAARPANSDDLMSPERIAAVRVSSPDAAQVALEQRTRTRWVIHRDPLTGRAARGRGGRLAQGSEVSRSEVQRMATGFVDDNRGLLGISGLTPETSHVLRSRRGWHVVWQQNVDDRPVVGAFLNVTLREDGEVVAFRSRWIPDAPRSGRVPDATVALRTCEARLGQRLHIESTRGVWAVLPQDTHYGLVAARQVLVANDFGGRWQALVTSSGVLQCESLLRHELLQGTASGAIKPLYAQDPDVERTYPWLHIVMDDARSTTTHSNAVGSWSLSLPAGPIGVEATLDGLYASVRNSAGDPQASFTSQATIPGNVAVHFGAAQARSDERTLYYHTNLIHDWAAETLEFTLMDFPVPVTAAVRNPNNGSPDYANAFWDGNGMSFGNGGGRFANFGLFADVIYHEYTHGITDYMYRPVGGLTGPLGGAIHEALSDYFACTLTDEPLIGEQLAELGGAFRDLDNSLVWPDDRDPGDEVHRNGEILAGALWDVRMIVGNSVADPIIHFARTLHPMDFEEYLDAILIQDDLLFGDGAAANGTPHDDAILQAFAKHGMGPLSSREVKILHNQLGDTEAVDMPRDVVARISSQLPGVIDEMTLSWSTDTQSQRVPMQAMPSGDWSAQIPPQPEGTQVSYWLEAVKLRPRQETRLPDGAPTQTFVYTVGPDTEPPVIQHAAPQALPAFAWPATLGLRISDNLGVATAWVEYRRNGGPVSALGLVAMPEDPTSYRTTFPNVGGAVGETFEYWIVAQDASQAAHVTRLPATGSFSFSMVETLEDGFEQEAGVWLHRPAVPGREDPWHITRSDNHTAGGQNSWLCGNAEGGLPIFTAAELSTDWYLLGSGATASLWSRMDAEPNGPTGAFDAGIIQILVEGDLSPVLLTPLGGYPRTMGETADTNVIPPGTPCLSGTDADWQLLEFDLSPWAGKRVQLSFVFGSDNVSSLHSGWWLDDFSLSPGVRSPTDADSGGTLPNARLLVHPPAPNPFNPRVTFTLRGVPDRGNVRLDILDARGRLTRTLFTGILDASTRNVVWDGRNAQGREVASGVYWYRLRSPLGVESGSLVLVR